MKYGLTLLTKEPKPVMLLDLQASIDSRLPRLDDIALSKGVAQLVPELESIDLTCQFRGVSIERLRTVMETGIDVVPSDHHIYVGHLEKALEYGGWPKVVLALRRDQLERTFREIPADTRAEEIGAIRARFPTLVKSDDGKKLWLSRLPRDDTALAKPHELRAAWIPGSAFDALAAVFLLTHPDRGGTDAVSAALKALS